MKLPEEIPDWNYPAMVEMLIQAGAPLPARISGGSNAVQDILRNHNVPDELEADA
jgi:hypothetical protein